MSAEQAYLVSGRHSKWRDLTLWTAWPAHLEHGSRHKGDRTEEVCCRTQGTPSLAIAPAIRSAASTWILLRDTTNVLLEGVPRGLELKKVRMAIASVPDVAGVHDLHVWSMSDDDITCTVHVTVTAGADANTVRQAVATLLDEQFEIEHTTVQTEAPGEVSEELRHGHD
jgi:divalent metal cation (Fe/Co/Zn/Cd) transporter